MLHPSLCWYLCLLPPACSTLDLSSDPDKVVWLPGARINIAAAALACPRASPHDDALVWAREDAPNALQRMSWQELRQAAYALAARLGTRFKPGQMLIPLSCQVMCTLCGLTAKLSKL